jgi:REP element-mobilizing transposase RayT
MLDGLFRRRRLPHWDVDDGTYFVTACLHGSIPAQGLVELYRYREELEAQSKPPELSAEEWEWRRHKLVFARFDELIDLKPVVKHLENPTAADIVRDAIYHFAGDRYDLIAFVVMPSHFHWVFHPRREWIASLRVGQTFLSVSSTSRGRQECLPHGARTPRERIMQSIKGYTAYRCNQLLGTTGTFWQAEAYDHVVRDEQELRRIVEYVEQNPVRAGLTRRPEDWRWCSAADRGAHSVAPGEYLLR